MDVPRYVVGKGGLVRPAPVSTTDAKIAGSFMQGVAAGLGAYAIARIVSQGVRR